MRDLYINFVVVQDRFLNWGFNRHFDHDIQWESSRSISFLVWCYTFATTFSIFRVVVGREYALEWFYVFAVAAAILALYIGRLHYKNFSDIESEVKLRKLSRTEKVKALLVILLMPLIVVLLFSI